VLHRAEITTEGPALSPDVDALPFVKPASSAPPPIQRASPPAAAPPGITKAPSALRTTGRLPELNLLKPALPFQPAPAAPGGPAAGAKTPVPPAAAATPPPLTMEQYASLTIDLLLDPARAQETLHRYRLTPPQKAQLDAAWQARFAANPSARTGFDAACAAYRAWRLQNRG
jgi:hypothetical protein